jgi:hypothetical protein
MWVKVDDGFPEHAKVLRAAQALDSTGAGALGRVVAVWLVGMCYANRNLTDGFLPLPVVRTWTLFDKKPMAVVAALLVAGLLEEVPGGYQFHDYEHYQPSASTVKSKRDADRKRKRLARESKENPTRVAEMSARNPTRSRARDPDPARPEDQNPRAPALARRDVQAVENTDDAGGAHATTTADHLPAALCHSQGADHSRTDDRELGVVGAHQDPAPAIGFHLPRGPERHQPSDGRDGTRDVEAVGPTADATAARATPRAHEQPSTVVCGAGTPAVDGESPGQAELRATIARLRGGR